MVRNIRIELNQIIKIEITTRCNIHEIAINEDCGISDGKNDQV